MPQSRLRARARIISYIYSHLVLNKELSGVAAFESGDYSDFEIKVVEIISRHFNDLQAVVSRFLKASWAWDRINYLEQAILIYGAFELRTTDKALVINELVDIAKGYIPGSQYKFINAVLDQIGAFYANQN